LGMENNRDFIYHSMMTYYATSVSYTNLSCVSVMIVIMYIYISKKTSRWRSVGGPKTISISDIMILRHWLYINKYQSGHTKCLPGNNPYWQENFVKNPVCFIEAIKSYKRNKNIII